MIAGNFTYYRPGAWKLLIVPQSVLGIADLLSAYSLPFISVFGVSFITEARKGRRIKALERLADSVNIRYHSEPDVDILTLAREDLGRLLHDLIHWDFHCWDAPRQPSPKMLRRQAEVMANVIRSYPAFLVLNLLDGARFFLDSHDDDELTIESRTPDLVQAVFARVLETMMVELVSKATGRSGNVATIAPIPPALSAHFMHEVPSFMVREAAPKKPSRVRLEYGATDTTLDWRSYRLIGHIDYDVRTDRWVYPYN